MNTVTYNFENLIPYNKLQARIRDKWHYRDNKYSLEADEFAMWTLKKPAMEESKQNLSIMLERAKAAGISHLIAGYHGLQVLSTMDRTDLDNATHTVFDKQYFESLNGSYKKDLAYGSVDSTWRYGNSESHSFLKLYDWKVGKHLTKDLLGVYDVQTGKRIKGRNNILNLFWDMGFLGRRGYVLEAARPDSGTPQDVIVWHQVSKIIDTLPSKSLVRNSFNVGINKIDRLCAYPLDRVLSAV